MLKRLVEFFASATSGAQFKFTLQDITHCSLWVEGRQHQEVADELNQNVRKRIQSWVRTPDILELQTAGRRHQGLLRTLLSKAAGGQLNKLLPDEVAFLCRALELAEESEADVHTRFLERIAPHRSTLLQLRETTPPSAALHQLEPLIQYATEADIQAAPPSEIRLLAGIELPSRGPVFKSSGNLRILGDVPDNCTVVVENEGYCSVDGYVMGRILTKKYCEIRHNISGVAIVLRGHIRARSIINNALAISKMGSVVCVNAQGPKLIFGGQSIEIAQNAMLGTYITRTFTVGEDVRGGHVEIAESGSARHFRHLGTSSMAIVLRRELSCEDFGEVTGDELNKLLSRAYSLRRSARNFKHMRVAALREADHTAQSILMYIFGGGEIQKRLQGFLQAQRRHTLVSNVVDNLQGILAHAQDGLISTVVQASEEPEARYESAEEEIEPDEELIGAQAEADKLHKSLRAQSLDRTQRTLLLEEVRLKLGAMIALQGQTAEKMKEEERAIQHLEKYEMVLKGGGEELTKIEVLNRILPAMRQQAPDSTMGKRLRSAFIIRALRTVSRASRHAEEFGTKAEQYLLDFRTVSERLGKDYQIHVLENPEMEGRPARVTGIFDGGTRIFMDVYLDNLTEAPAGSIISTPEDSRVQTYIRDQPTQGFHSP